MANKNSSLGFVAGAVLGGLIGAGLGILFAPEKGTETRKKLKKMGEDTINKAEAKMSELKKEKLDPMIAKGEKEMKKLGKDLQHRLDKAREEFAEKVMPADK